MANEMQCKDCTHYFPQRKPKPNGGFKELGYGHCVAKSIYAKNKVGKPIYPPGAVIKELPFAQHIITIVKSGEIVPLCSQAKARS